VFCPACNFPPAFPSWNCVELPVGSMQICSCLHCCATVAQHFSDDACTCRPGILCLRHDARVAALCYFHTSDVFHHAGRGMMACTGQSPMSSSK
jgi:hypothetical protein